MANTQDANHKRCSRCERHLPLGSFGNYRSSSDGLQSYCKECQSADAKARRFPAVPLPVRRCEYCESEYTPRIRKQRFCSANCKQRSLYWRRNPRLFRPCAGCGVDISQYRRDRKWCSEACKHKHFPEPRRDAVRKHRFKLFGLTPETFEELLESQNGCCAICGTDEIRGFGKRMAIDHCHSTGSVRGILCGNCNRGIGSFGDDPERLERAAAYLRK